MTQPDLLIFHVDGALVDTTQSVDQAVRRTVQNYFSHFLGVHGSGSLLTEEDVQAFRFAGGFDNPWTLSAALIRYLLSLLPPIPYDGHPPSSPGEAVGALKRRRAALGQASFETIQKRARVAEAAAKIRTAGGGPAGVARVLGRWAHPLLISEGSAQEGNLVRHLFQEIYLGRYEFARLERMPSQFYRGPGLIGNEQARLDDAAVRRLRARYAGSLGAVTEWPRGVAQHSLGNLKLDSFFDVLIAYEDIVSEEARLARRGEAAVPLHKPHPFMVLEAAATLDPGGTRPAVYVGSTADDMRAARAAALAGPREIVPWALLPPTSDPVVVRALLDEAGAERLFESPDELATALLGEHP